VQRRDGVVELLAALVVAAQLLAEGMLEQAFVDQIAGRLAVYLGPIAPIVTRKAARDAKTRSEFVRRVADSLGTQERAAFLREVGYGDS